MLSDDDRALLDLEACGWVHDGAKVGAIGLRLGLNPHRYYARLNALLDEPAAAQYAPALVSRLRRRRDAARHRARTAPRDR